MKVNICKTLEDVKCLNCLTFNNNCCVKENRAITETDPESWCGEGLWLVTAMVQLWGKNENGQFEKTECVEITPMILDRVVRELLNPSIQPINEETLSE
jgi:hypothetical protein